MFCSQLSTVVMSSNWSHFDVSRRCNHSVGVAMCLMRPAHLRIAMARPAVTSQLDFKAGTVDSIAWHFRFDFNSLLLQNHTKITHHRNRVNPRSYCLYCFVAVQLRHSRDSQLPVSLTKTSEDVSRMKILQELVLLRLCKHPAKFEVAKARDLLVVNILSFEALDASWVLQQETNSISSMLRHQPLSVPPSLLPILHWQLAIQFGQLTNTHVS